jgi:hypothetical protein
MLGVRQHVQHQPCQGRQATAVAPAAEPEAAEPEAAEPAPGTSETPADEAALRSAESKVRKAVPAAEAYYADNDTYVGMTAAALRVIDNGIDPGVTVVSVTATSYCVEYTSGSVTASYAGPGGSVLDEPCA